MEEKRPPIDEAGIPHHPVGSIDAPPPGWKPPLADVSWVKRKFLDVPYGRESKNQCFDIYLPDEGDGPFPLLVNIHGGAFELGDKREEHMDTYLKALAKGYAVASLEYRFSFEAKFPAAPCDCREAIRYIKSHAEGYCVDVNRIAVIGGSAGGNLATMVGMNVPNGAFPGEENRNDFSCEPTVHVVINQFGPVKFETMQVQAKANGISKVFPDMEMAPETRYLGISPMKAPKELLDASYPATYASERMASMLVQHGTMDRLVPCEQSEELVKDIQSAGFGHKVAYIPLEGADHDDKRFFADDNMNIVFDFIAKHL